MEKVTINNDTLTSIANAIRLRNGKTDTYKPSDMPAEIRAITVDNIPDMYMENAFLSGTSFEYENNGLTYLRDDAFYNNKGLTKATFGKVTETGGSVFYRCSNLQEINMFALQELGPYMFEGCTNLTTVSLPNVKKINSGCFRGCSSLETLTFPNLQAGAGMAVFANCPKLRCVDFGYGATIFASFANCPLLEALILRYNGVVDLSESEPFNSGCYIYVPSSYVESYKTNATWSKYTNQIRAIEDYPDICG